jgi:hypothetical protein
MAVIYDNTMKAARMTATRDAVADGTIEIQAANNDVLAIFGLSETGGTVATDTWTLALDSSGATTGLTAAGAGTTATKARIKNSGGTVRVTGLTVGTTAADIILDNTSIADGQTVTLASGAIQHAADPS